MDTELLKCDGLFQVLALDHRSSLLNKVSSEDLLEFKKIALKVLSPMVSADLLDEDYGLKAYQELGLTTPFLLNLEKSGYRQDSMGRHTELEHSVADVKALGASGVKLLVYYNHNDSAAKLQRNLVVKVSKDCVTQKIPLVLEIIAYDSAVDRDTHYHYLNSSSESNFLSVSLSDFLKTDSKINIFKLPYPGSPEACRRVTALIDPVPWVMLSGGDDFEVFLSEYEIATKNGCRGFFAGRALWQEALDLPKDEWEKFFEDTAKPRLERLTRV